ncbi:hypothetical protein JAAARDRAFT_31036 [Jaapia argillacea MUCL 33604]|uniref:Ataxin-10 homolog n=1 Tax=Jaapia argillacea MUCL 33604 TaxID=933084 RepID=A0A067Q5Y1_9AGAM|nr:hypothetical protein JAAARDRAFT_31036 [Jaapia argillacea MUCL 33604]
MARSDTNVRFCNACNDFEVVGLPRLYSLKQTLDEFSSDLAKSEELRGQVGECSPSIYPPLRRLWQKIVDQQLLAEPDASRAIQDLCWSLAKFTRNFVAGIPHNQLLAFENEPDIRRLIHHYTSFSVIQHEDPFAVTRMLAQTLSNMVTANETLVSQLWDLYIGLPEEQNILIRLLASPDDGSVVSTLVLVLNCIHGNNRRSGMLASNPVGTRICKTIFERINSSFEAEDDTIVPKTFEMGYHVFVRLLEAGYFPDLYANLAIEGEVIAPHQTTLLKVQDSYLQSPPSGALSTETIGGLTPFTISTFFTLSSYTQRAIEKFIGSPSHDGQPAPVTTRNELDLVLPKVCEALVLLSQCLVSVALQVAEHRAAPQYESVTALLDGKISAEGQGLVESVISTLGLLDTFLPRINFGKAVPSIPGQTLDETPDSTGFQYVKRDLVRLLGVLCHDNKTVQDRIRGCGGVPIMMNMCVMDERNPFLREHAILALRNLLHGNAENQAVVEEIKPMWTWDTDGTLRERPASR